MFRLASYFVIYIIYIIYYILYIYTTIYIYIPSLLTDYKISNFVTFSYSGSFGKK